MAVKYLVLAILCALALAITSLFIGVSDVSITSLLSSGPDGRAAQVLVISRIPRTMALILAGSSMAIAGLIMQMLVRNRFVEPSTAGTVESATLGLLVVTMLGFIAGGLIAVPILISKVVQKKYEPGKHHLAFGPYLALSAYVCLFFGYTIVAWYFSKFGMQLLPNWTVQPLGGWGS